MQNRIEKKWAAYAGAAAAVVGGSGAHGAIIGQSLNVPFNTSVLSAPLDFNSDGIVDYELLRGGNGGTDTDYVDLKQGLNASLGSTNRFVLDVPSNRIASLTAGTEIGPASSLDSNFDGVTGAGGSVSLYDERKQGNGQPGPSGNFRPDNIVGNPEYVGVRFKIGGEGIDYYGWIAVDFTSLADVAGVVTGIAYEDTGAAIIAGDMGAPTVVRGDFNFDGGVDASDIDPFVVAANEGDPFAGYIASFQSAFALLYPGQTLDAAVINAIGDFNGDGGVDASDIDPFVVFANNGGSVSAIPEPSGLAALAMGAAFLIRRKGR